MAANLSRKSNARNFTLSERHLLQKHINSLFVSRMVGTRLNGTIINKRLGITTEDRAVPTEGT